MDSIIELLNTLQNDANALASLPVRGYKEKRLNCIYKKMQAPSFLLVFPGTPLPLDQLKTQSQFQLSVSQDSNSVNLTARIESIEDENTLLVVATKSIRPELLREYFRITFRTPLKASYQPGSEETKSHPWTLNAETLDISGGGVLAMFKEEPKNRHRINLELMLPNNEEPIVTVAKVIRCHRLRKEHFRVALHFENIKDKARDVIIAFCLQEQRRQLRNQIRTN